METFYVIWTVFMVLILLYRMIFQKFKKHNRENIGLSAILIIFTGSSYSLTQMNLILVIGILALAAYSAVWNSILFVRKGYENPRLR
jgi:Kef-type K+ transport system membrane component KefB